MITSGDIEEIVSKLSSDKAKVREEGIKLLNTWLEGERVTSFCRYLSQKTAKLQPDELFQSETWPFIVKLLTQCASLEISSSKRRLPKLIFAKTLRIVVQKAEETKFSGMILPLLCVVKSLFNHIWDVLNKVSSFQAEYGIILRHLLSVRDYRFHLRKRLYNSLVLFYMEKVAASLSEKNDSQYNSKDELFRNILTLHSLFENPPGDFPNNVREDIVKGIGEMFSFIRDEGKVSRKLIECVNTYLVKDGPNLGCYMIDIHNAAQQFVFRFWVTTHDRVLKDTLIFYARLQLHYIRGSADRSHLIEQLLDVVYKELNQYNVLSSGLWSDAAKEDKIGSLNSSLFGLVELAATVIHQACATPIKALPTEKRVKKEHVSIHLKEALMEGKWLWNAVFCCLARNFTSSISKDLFFFWFEGICSSFERILKDANTEHSYDSLVWSLRGLQELSSVLLNSHSMDESSSAMVSTSNEFERGWQLIWSCLVHGFPMFSNVSAVVDATMILLGNIILRDLVSGYVIPQDIWDLSVFKCTPSPPVLYFISCYFSRKMSQVELHDILRLRKNLLRSVLTHLNCKESSVDNRELVLLLPAAVYALCSGCAASTQCCEAMSQSYSFDVAEAVDDMMEEDDQESSQEVFDCSVEVIAKVHFGSPTELPQWPCPPGVHLPRHVRDPLLDEMENVLLGAAIEMESEKESLSKVFFKCTLFMNFIHCSTSIRKREHVSSLISKMTDYILEFNKLMTFQVMNFIHCSTSIQFASSSSILFSSSFYVVNLHIFLEQFKGKREHVSSLISKMTDYILELLDRAVNVIEESHNAFQQRRWFGSDSMFGLRSHVLASFKSFFCCPLFAKQSNQYALDGVVYNRFIQSIERLLKALSKLYQEYSEFVQSEVVQHGFSRSNTSLQNHCQLDSKENRLIDMDLDANNDSRKTTSLTAQGIDGIPSSRHWKLSIITLVSCFFSVLHDITWKVLLELLEKEIDLKVCGKILYNICVHFSWSSSEKVPHLINIMNDLVERQGSLRLDSCSVLSGIHGLLKSLLSFENGEECKPVQSFKDTIMEEDFIHLGELVNKVAENDFLDWSGRIKLVDCICDLVLIRPGIGQTMIERLLLMLRDPDYRVRFCLARRISVLFQTWDGHHELFQDICVNFGVLLVTCLKEKVVTAKEVLDIGPQPHTTMETIIMTLGHLAFHSEKIEMQAVFMMCVISAIDPSKRELVLAILDNLSKQLNYSTRQKYMEELMGSILFCWVACGVSLLALVEIRQFFVSDAEPNYFLQYCFPWLLPALVIHGDHPNLDWFSKVAGQSVSALLKDHFVPIFALSIALHCSERSGSEKGTLVLQGTILNLAQISESERDALIKKNMVSIVSKVLSLTSCASDPMVPFFSKDGVSRAIQTVVDGFMEIQENEMSAVVIDKINIFRPDRVFTFIIELHYKIAAAVHPRHKRHRLAGVEVLLTIIGHRAAISSTSNYLFNLVGQLINCQALKDQCYCILSALLKTFKYNPSIETINVLGEQLQFLVSKLVACCIPSEVHDEPCDSKSSHILSLLLQLTVDSDPSLYHYVKELEPFPEIEIFDEIRMFHQELCQGYSPRDHLLKFAKRACELPPRLLPWSLKALHKKLIREGVSDGKIDCVVNGDWHCDSGLVKAVWKLVRMCELENAHNVRELVSDFVSKVGIGDPRCVVFYFPCKDSNNIHVSWPKNDGNPSKMTINMCSGLSDDLLIAVLKLLKKYLIDESVKIVDMTSQALRVILSTERGQRALMTFDSYEKSLLEVHSKGVDMKLVDNFLLDLETKFNAEDNSLETSTVWETNNKSFEGWICSLVYSLIGYCCDVILRLCQDVVSCKAELAELLLPCVMVNLAGRKDMDFDLHKIVSMQVQEHIFAESNKSVKSIQVMLSALNELRLCHVLERFQISFRQENFKSGKPSSYSSKSRSTAAKARVSTSTSSGLMTSTSLWNKVYWLSIDYLIVAEAALLCGSYFTSILYVEHWCKEHFNSLTLGNPEFSHIELLPHHIEILVSAITQINEPDGLYGIIQSHKLSSQIITFEHEGNWSKALEYYDLQVRSKSMAQADVSFDLRNLHVDATQPANHLSSFSVDDAIRQRKPYKGIVRSLQQIGCSHVLDLYCQGLTSRNSQFQEDFEFCEQQYEAAWQAGNWDFSLLNVGSDFSSIQYNKRSHFNENLHSCLRALQEGDFTYFHRKLRDSKQELVQSITHASEESTEFIYSTIIKLQIFYHLGMAWDLRWPMSALESISFKTDTQRKFLDPVIPTIDRLTWLNADWSSFLERTHLHMSLLEPFMVFRRVLLQVLSCKESIMKHHVQSASILRKKSRFSQAAAAIQEFKYLCVDMGEQNSSLYWQGRLEEAKLLRAQDQHTMAISLAKYISQNWATNEEASDVFRLVGKWLAETRSSNSRTILEKYLKPSVSLTENKKFPNAKTIERQSQTNFYLAHYADALFRSYEERLNSNEWQAAMRLRKHKTIELEALIRRLKRSTKGEKTDFSIKIQELQKQLSMDREEAIKLQDDRDNFLTIALEGYKRCLVVGDKYDVRVVFRLISLWFTLSSRQNVINSMLSTIVEVQSYKFIPLVYQIASRMGSGKDVQGPNKFQFALVSLVKKMAIDHPYHTIFQLLALANGDRIKDKQRSRNSFVVDIDKKLAAEKLLEELSSYHGPIIGQMKQMVEIYIKLAELETKKEDTSKRIPLPREMRSLGQLELVPVVTATLPVDRSCQYYEGSFPFFKGLSDTVTIMNGINAPKVVECEGSDGSKYRQLAKSGNDDLRQDAVMEQFFGLVNTFLHNHQDTWKRRLGVRTYKVVPFTPSAGVLEWVDGTIPLGEYLIGSSRNGGAHGRYGMRDWSFLECRDIMTKEKDKRKAFQEVCENFRPVMHQFFLERFLQPAVWFEKRLAYTRSVAASSMVGYIVGLGDRHSMNILIDQATAEVVHIDLGVAFEQGLMLKTPERVPFRLTRDIIDGMGVTGVEGIFRRCCEETLSVMRTNKEALLTIVEVFIHDPLYKWALSPLKALQRQKETDDDLENSLEELEDEHEGNKDAARALMRVKQKLDGYEDGEMRSIHGQVQQLIQDATDPERLCHMFPGWGAWM